MRADTLWKKAPSQVMSSVAFSSRVPTASRAAVVVMTTLEWKVSFRKLPALRMSSITRKAQAAEDDQGAGDQIQQHVALIGDEVLHPAQDVKARVVEGGHRVEHRWSTGPGAGDSPGRR